MYIHIDSRNRDQVLYPYSNSFAMDLYTPIKNITACKILTANVPAGPVTEPYLFVDIQELRSSQVIDVPAMTTVNDGEGGVITTPNGLSTNWFVGIIPNDGSVFTSGGTYDMTVTYDTPIDKISRFTVKITDFTGKPVEIGTSNVCIVLDLHVLPEGSKPIERTKIPDPVNRPVLTKPAVQISNKVLFIGLAILGLFIILLVPKLKRRQ